MSSSALAARAGAVVIPSAMMDGPPDLGIRMAILDGLYPDDGWKPTAVCPNSRCRHELSPWDVLMGFNDSPTDVSTACPQCQTRFPAALAAERVGPRRQAFWCGGQLVHVLRAHPGLQQLGLETLLQQRPEIVATARFHFGTLTQAFAAIGVHYTGEAQFNLRARLQVVAQGIDADTIARHLGMEVGEVERLIAS